MERVPEILVGSKNWFPRGDGTWIEEDWEASSVLPKEGGEPKVVGWDRIEQVKGLLGRLSRPLAEREIFLMGRKSARGSFMNSLAHVLKLEHVYYQFRGYLSSAPTVRMMYSWDSCLEGVKDRCVAEKYKMHQPEAGLEWWEYVGRVEDYLKDWEYEEEMDPEGMKSLKEWVVEMSCLLWRAVREDRMLTEMEEVWNNHPETRSLEGWKAIAEGNLAWLQMWRPQMDSLREHLREEREECDSVPKSFSRSPWLVFWGSELGLRNWSWETDWTESVLNYSVRVHGYWKEGSWEERWENETARMEMLFGEEGKVKEGIPEWMRETWEAMKCIVDYPPAGWRMRRIGWAGNLFMVGFLTEDIWLTDVDGQNVQIGELDVEIMLKRLEEDEETSTGMKLAVKVWQGDRPKYCPDGYVHPHVAGGHWVCYGDMGAIARKVAKELDWVNLAEITASTLRSYVEDAAFIRLSAWREDEGGRDGCCSICGIEVGEEYNICGRCSDTVCLDCSTYVESLDESWCQSCVDAELYICDKCSGLYRQDDMYICEVCGATLCPECVVKGVDGGWRCEGCWPNVCERCGGAFDWEGEGGAQCDDCGDTFCDTCTRKINEELGRAVELKEEEVEWVCVDCERDRQDREVEEEEEKVDEVDEVDEGDEDEDE